MSSERRLQSVMLACQLNRTTHGKRAGGLHIVSLNQKDQQLSQKQLSALLSAITFNGTGIISARCACAVLLSQRDETGLVWLFERSESRRDVSLENCRCVSEGNAQIYDILYVVCKLAQHTSETGQSCSDCCIGLG